MTQATKPQGQEGGLAHALLEWHSISGGKPAFLTLRLSKLSHRLRLLRTLGKRLVDQPISVALKRAQEYLGAQNKSSPFTHKR